MSAPSEPVQTFGRYAMATEFHLLIAHDDRLYARQAAEAALDELPLIEERLSRHLAQSDVGRIQRASPGEPVLVAPDTLECLAIALRIGEMTGGMFDVAYRSSDRRPAKEWLRLDPQRHCVIPLHEGLALDLGGIGKGFALDRMAATLEDWGLTRAYLKASTSTYLAIDPPAGREGWEAGLGPGTAHVDLVLRRRALSSSGTAVQGAHIFDPHTGQATRRYRAWSLAPTGAEADALSTAFMLMPEREIRSLLGGAPEFGAWIQAGPDDVPIELRHRPDE